MLLLAAAGVHSKPCVQVILENLGWWDNINLAIDDRSGGVLQRALGRNDCPKDFIVWLLELGADPNLTEPSEKRHSLVCAVYHGSIPIIKLLIAHGADVNGSKALHAAASSGKLERVKFLVEEAGANVNEPGHPRADRY
ncbi:hypothetical protein MPH_13337 [Macrophomina phaseolina MS6]|uniref:Uncharacterized protein n=1 Tax=Macrophomina phaseolina (strain MS6) TaxID=1126212 RepID=K2R9T8_MACPH|nr:hypothetical protein MPH_13337 [Macrophomina phaseolina MS6]